MYSTTHTGLLPYPCVLIFLSPNGRSYFHITYILLRGGSFYAKFISKNVLAANYGHKILRLPLHLTVSGGKLPAP